MIGVSVALADGTLASSGGKVVKNVAGYDLPKLMTGAFGTLAVVTRAIFRLHPLPRETRTISCVTSSAAEAQQVVLAIQNSKLAHSALQICWGAGIRPRVDVLFEGTEAGLAGGAGGWGNASSLPEVGANLEGVPFGWLRFNSIISFCILRDVATPGSKCRRRVPRMPHLSKLPHLSYLPRLYFPRFGGCARCFRKTT